MKTINACVKNSKFTAIFDTHFKGRIDLTRLRLMAHFMCALCTVRAVSFEKLAKAFDHTAPSGSSHSGGSGASWRATPWTATSPAWSGPTARKGQGRAADGQDQLGS